MKKSGWKVTALYADLDKLVVLNDSPLESASKYSSWQIFEKHNIAFAKTKMWTVNKIFNNYILGIIYL